ncbi:MAG: hypothetical protein WCI71_07315 [Bacteroidota bacterium]
MRRMLIFLVGFLVLTSACRKKDTTESGPVPPADTTHVPPVFNNVQPKIMSEFEIRKGVSMHGHLLTNSLTEVDPFGIAMGLFDVINFIEGFEEHKQEMDELNSKLNHLHVQDSLLSTGIADLINQMNYSTAVIMNQINDAVALGYISDIQTRYGNQDHNGLRYYSQAGANYKHNVPGYDSVFMAGPLRTELISFDSVNSRTPQIDHDFNGLNLLICPVIPMDTSCLMTFAKVLIGQFSMAGEDTSQAAMVNTYLLLESYFLTLMNYQFEAATVKMNVLKNIDTLQAQSFWASTVRPAFLAETDMFLQAANYLLINLCDYRTNARWQKDIPFSGISMAPNAGLLNAMARAQFRVAGLYQALHASPQVVYGSIIVPRGFCASPPLIQIGSDPYLLPAGVAQGCKARFPYAEWNYTNMATCTPDNYWMIYNYNLPANAGSGSSSINVNPTWPRLSQSTGYGTITPLWYNPRNPAETSPVKTDSCIIQFASFCLSWQWGILMTDYINASFGVENRNLFCQFENPIFCPWCGNGSNSTQLIAPLVAQWHSDQDIFEHIQQDAERNFGRTSLGNNSPFHYQLTVSMQPYSSGAVFLYDQIAMPVSVPQMLPNGYFSFFTSYSTAVNLNPWPSSLKNLSFMMGSTINDMNSPDGCGTCTDRACYISNGNIVKGALSTGTGMAYSPYETSGTYYPGFQYWLNVYKSNVATSASIQVYIDAQVVFTGYAGY